MHVALVRTIPDNNGNWDFIGLFTYRTFENLFWAIDEQHDPLNCEILDLEEGMGLFFNREIDVDGDIDIPVNPKFSEMLDIYLYEDNHGLGTMWYNPHFNVAEIMDNI